MKIAMLSRHPKSYTAGRFKEAAKERGHSLRVLDTLKFSLYLEEGHPNLTYDGKELAHYDAIIPRIGASLTFFGTAVVRHFEQMGVYTLNSSQAIAVSRDKLRSLQILSRHEKIGIPHTAFVRSGGDIAQAIEKISDQSIIIKLLEGTQGVGVMLAESSKVAQSIVETLHSKQINVLLQKFVSESKGKDIRAFVVGNKVIAAARRVAQGDEFRSNLHRGGSATPVELDEEYSRAAVRAAQVMGLSVAGVDMLEGNDGPQIMEVNSSPGLQGIETSTGIDVAGAVIEHMAEQAKFPEIDLRQRLTTQGGYGVADLHVTKKLNLANKALSETGLREQEISVLCIERPDSIIPNPKGTDVIQLGDKLLCYGNLKQLGQMLPKRVKKKRPKSDKTP